MPSPVRTVRLDNDAGIARMVKVLRIQLTVPPSSDLVHRFRNFGEDVYREWSEECAVSIEEITCATSTFHVREIHKRFVRTAAAKVREISRRHHMSEIVNVDEIPETTNA